MAVPSYTEDLTDIDLAEAGSTGIAVNFSGGGGGAPAAGIDLALQGTNAWDRPVSNAERGIVFNQTPGAPVIAAGAHIYQWLFCGTPGLTDTLALRGAYVCAGTGTGALVQFHVEGNDTYGAAGRVGKCYPYRYVTTSNTGSIPYRTLTGSPGATPTYFGAGLKTTASAKGSNLGVDAVRYGTGAYLTAGELISAGDASDNPCTFVGFQAQNDAIANRWGILTRVGGSYELQGAFVIGQNSSKVATLCRFSASDRSIIVVDTPHSETTFNKFIIDHASTRCEWNNINIIALGTNSRGSILVNNSSTTFLAVGGVWESLSTIGLKAASVLTSVTLRLTDQITLGGATLTDCTIDRNRASSAILAANINEITGCQFNSDGTGHAVEITTLGLGTMTWDNKDTGYASVDGSTGNETLYVNVGAGLLTINVAEGASTPTIRTAGATINVVAGLASFKFTVSPSITGYEWRIYTVTALGSLAGATEVAGQESATQDNQTYNYLYTADQFIAVQILAFDEDYEERVRYFTLTENNQDIQITLNKDNNN